MGQYWDRMGTSTNTLTTLADFFLGISATAGRYSTQYDGTLKMVRVITGYQAATSLQEGVRIELTCSLWTPNKIVFDVTGHGVHTAPGVASNSNSWDIVINQPVAPSNPITMQAVQLETSAVTPRIILDGLFEA